MFGYVIVDKPSLRIREYDYYRATYCGLCHAMGKCTGCASRLTLSYDTTFFVLVREMLDGTKAEFVKKRCVRHPIKKIETVKINPQLEYSACVGAQLAYGKIVDNINDEKGMKRFVANICKVLFSRMDMKSFDQIPTISGFISEKLELISQIEEERTKSIDVPAEVFGDMMAGLLAYGFEGEKKMIAEKIGKRIGRWIYIVDAFDDYESDRKSGSYNPFVELYDGEDFGDDDLLSISKMLEAELSIAFSAIELLDDDGDKNRSEIIKNILCLGMPASVERLCKKKEKNKEEKN
ncbi:MAG: hypothetical protein J6U74_03070 [Clostridia bacterium]|nr:hypothetical protein [Clostridia bacterium]